MDKNCTVEFIEYVKGDVSSRDSGNNDDSVIREQRFVTDRIRRMGEGNVFSLSTGGEATYPKVPSPGQVRTRGGGGVGYPKVPTHIQVRMGEGVSQGTYPPTKVPTPHQAGQDKGRGSLQGTYPSAKVPTTLSRSGWGGVPQGTYPPIQVRTGGRRYPKVPTPPPHPGIVQHMEYLIRCGRYASCFHAGGFSC